MATIDDVKGFRDMLHDIQVAVEKQISAGKSVEETVAAKPTRAYDDKWGNGFVNPDQFTTLVYTGLMRHSAKG